MLNLLPSFSSWSQCGWLEGWQAMPCRRRHCSHRGGNSAEFHKVQSWPTAQFYARHTKSTSDLAQGVYVPDHSRMRTPAQSGRPVTILPQARAYSPVSNRGSPAPVSPHGGADRSSLNISQLASFCVSRGWSSNRLGLH
eukprot:Skav211074  [mRNA]  locus=scaffold314:298044:299999:- [translate_table: standard]